jgi:hypothetical protein
MDYKAFLLMFLLSLSFIMVAIVFATNFDSSVSPSVTDAGLVNQTFNFTINNTAATNITKLNITLPSGFSFIGSSNGTTATGASFDSTTSVLMWSNTTVEGFVNSTGYFWFNLSIPKNVGGNFDFNVSTLDTSGGFNSTNVTMAVNPTAWSSPMGEFYVKPPSVYVNWTYNYTNSITITVNETVSYWFNATVDNSTTLYFNYTTNQSCDAFSCSYLFVNNASGGYATTSESITGGSTSILTLIARNLPNLWAGRYWASIRVYNTSNATENANVTVFLDYPIQVDSISGTGMFNGTLPANAPAYQSFYFNTSNYTGVVVNLTSSQDVDVFLFDNSSTQKLMAKSINKTANAESLAYSFLPSVWGMWEIRVYGNYTSPIDYDGNIFFTTLNATNASNNAQQFSSIDFGAMNVSSTAQRNITLKNEGNLTLTNVQESKDIYYVKRSGGSAAGNFTFLVPDSSIASKVKAVLNWTGAANYSLSLFKPDGTLAANSTNKYVFANVSGAEHEEYNETTNITAGYWRVEVENNSVSTSPYNVTLFVYLANSSEWFASKYSTSGFTFNRTGLTDSTYIVQIDFTVPNASLDGIYEGYLQYLDQNSAKIKIPITINVTTPVLVVNQTVNSSTIRINENINANLMKVLNITVNNTGTYNLTSIVMTNSAALNYSSSNYIAFTSIQYPSSLSAGDSTAINITMDLNTTTTSDQTGLYKGWIFFNTNGSQYASHPYDFNLSIELNLTNWLNVSIEEVVAGNDNVANVTTSAENATVTLNIRYANGTLITGSDVFLIDGDSLLRNITNIRLYEANASYWIPNSTGSLAKTLLNNPEDPPDSGDYSFNVTVPANSKGGRYMVYVNATTKDGRLYGESSNGILIINDTGLYMNSSDSLSSVTTGSDVYYYVTVKNFGPFAATSAAIQFNDSTCTYVTITAYDYSSGTCTANPSGNAFTSLSIPAYNISGCWFRFKIHGDTNGTCSASTGYPMFVNGTSGNWFNNITGLAIVVSPTTTTTTIAASSLPPVGGTTEAPKHLDITSYPSLILVTQGSTNSTNVTVKNINTTRGQDIRVTVENINSSWFAATPTLLVGMLPLNSTNFTVLFSIPADAEVKDYSAKFTAISNFANVSKTFTLRVLPTTETKAQINSTLASFKQNMTELWGEINQSIAGGKNVTVANATFFQLKALIDQAQSHVNLGDYNSAFYLFGNIRTLFNTTRTQLSQALQEQGTGWFNLPSFVLPSGILFYVSIFGGIAAAVILLYLFWPVKTGEGKPTVEPQYTPKEEKKKENVIAMLKEKWSKFSKQKK